MLYQFLFSGKVDEAYDRIQDMISKEVRDTDYRISQDSQNCQLFISSSTNGKVAKIEEEDKNSVIVKVAQNEEEDSIKEIIVSWANRYEFLGSHLLSVFQNIGK